MGYLNASKHFGGREVVIAAPHDRYGGSGGPHTHPEYLDASGVVAGTGVTVETLDSGVVVISAAPSDADTHYVGESEPAAVDPEELPLQGRPPLYGPWSTFWGGNRWSTSWEPQFVQLAQIVPGSVLLDSQTELPVVPGDRFQVRVDLEASAGGPNLSAAPQLFLTTTDDDFFGPFDPQTVTLTAPTQRLQVGGKDELVWEIAVPDTITPTAGEGEPVLARFGLFLDQPDAATGIVTVRSYVVRRVTDTFSPGALWLNPAFSHQRSSMWMQWADATWRLSNTQVDASAPLAGSKVLRVSPPVDTEIVVSVVGRVRNISATTGGARFRIQPVLVDGDAWTVANGEGGRFYSDVGFTNRLEVGLPYQARMIAKAGSTVDLVLNFYADTDGQAQRHELYTVQGRVEFNPLMLEPNQETEQAEIRWWDGTGWNVRRTLEAEQYDAGTPPSKVATTTAITRSPSRGTRGTMFTVTATVSAPSGTPSGSVDFQHRRPGDSGWSTFATKTLSGGKASYKRGWTATGTVRLRAVYKGSGTHGKSTSAETTVVLS